MAVGLLVRLRGPATYGGRDLRWVAVAVLGWELVVVLLGGSYWLHYLMGLVPGLVLLAAAAAQRRLEAGPTLVVPYAAPRSSSTLAAIVYVVAVPIERPEAPVIDYLQTEGRPGDTAVVALRRREHPPRDRHDLAVRAALEPARPGPRPGARRARPRSSRGRTRRPGSSPTATSLDTWGVDATAADRVLHDRYRLAANAGTFSIFRLAE